MLQTVRRLVTPLKSLRRGCRLLLMTIALLAIAAPPARLDAAGDEYTLRGEDLQLTVSSKWAGCANGGYYPLRILVQNRGVDCTVSFAFAGDHDGLAGAQRTISVAQNASVKFSLPVPCVGYGTYGKLTVARNGRPVEGLARTLSIPDRNTGTTPRPGLLVISSTLVDFDPYETAVVSLLPESTAASAGGSYGGYSHGVAPPNHERIEPTMLPEEWISYSGLDFVALSLPTLEKMSETERAALLKWVQTGGSLIVFEVGAPAADSQPLNNLLNIARRAAVSEAWQPADPAGRTPIAIIEMDGYGNVVQQAEAAIAQEPEAEAEPAQDAPAAVFTWPEDADTFAARELMLGRVYAFRENPFPGTPHDWGWFLKSVPTEARRWTTRHGISARDGTSEFLQFLNPSVRGVPVTAFLLLITLFTVVIGPLNYIFLWRRRRLYLLLVTIPLIALGTSLALFGYSSVAHGFATKSRARTLTYVDQTAKSAVTLARIALYAGLAPSDGLRFSADTMVMPIWPEQNEFDSAMTDWTEQQNLRSGWLDSRTRTQFLTVGHRDERGRLEIAPAGTGLRVTNGFEWDLQALVVCDRDGAVYFAGDLPAGGSAELQTLTPQQRQEFVALVSQHPLAAPDMAGSSGGWFNWNPRHYGYGWGSSAAPTFSTSTQEQLFAQLKNPSPGETALPPGSYAAVLGESPGVELGLDRTRPQASLHLLMGRF